MIPKKNKEADGYIGIGSGHPLDNVVWAALTGTQNVFSIGNEKAKRFPPSITPYAGLLDHTDESFESLRLLMEPENDLVVLFTLREISPPAGFKILNRQLVDQMVCGSPVTAFQDPQGLKINELTDSEHPEIYTLIDSMSPGIFASDTMKIGRYFGIRKDGIIVAVAGERLRLDGYTEISSLCVIPELRGRGFGGQLIACLNNNIIKRNETSFLHVFSTNTSAISLYERLGFALRRRLHLLAICRSD